MRQVLEARATEKSEQHTNHQRNKFMLVHLSTPSLIHRPIPSLTIHRYSS
jgi:hypothetical protein